MEFAYPLALLLISPVVLGGWYAVRKGVPVPLIVSRVIILSLLIVALASPFSLEMSTVRDEAPRITVLSDQTFSMDLFERDTGQKVFDAIQTKTPTTYSQFAGIKSPVGDELIAAATGDNNIILVTDGNNNYGKDLFDAISFVSRAGTKVFAVKQEPIRNDVSIEIASPKNLIIGNENVFNIVVRQAGNRTSYLLDVQVDDIPVKTDSFVQTERTKVIPVSYTFTTLGTHRVTAQIAPSGEDWFKLNNGFFKSVFVVPKPKVLMMTDDAGSPLYEITTGLYDATLGDVPDDLTPFKTVIIDNEGASRLSAETLRTYVGGGGGLVVVGGDRSYDKGDYNNSPVESILPIISRAGEYAGGKNLVLVLDASGSTSATDPTTGLSFIGLIDANAINIIKNIGRDSRVGVVAFGGETAQTGLLPLSSDANRVELEQFIREIGPKGGDNPTDLDNGLRAAKDGLDAISGTKEVIVLSDGIMPPEGLEQIKKTAQSLINANIKIQFVQVLMSFQTVKTPYRLYDELAQAVNGQVRVLNPDERASTLFEKEPTATPAPTPTPEITFEYPLITVDSSHFITHFINLTAAVTGYNEVTPKLGADSLVSTTRGKPVLTTWGFGLGRVAAFSTDNGAGNTRWASALYSGQNARLISSMINWAIGDPRPKEGVVVQAEDTWAGTSSKVVITSDTLPQVTLDGSVLDLSRTGPSTYETSINLEKEGFHDLSGYGIAVNYPIEYQEVGFNEKLDTVIQANGGRVYTPKEVEGLLLLDIKEKAVRTVQEPRSEKEPFLLAALLLFLSEVIVRRLKERGKERPIVQENLPRGVPVVEPGAE